MATKKPYHKEDLQRDLLAAGRAWVTQHGHLGLSIRTLAQQVGVSPGAPYHHFPDRRSFLLALAKDGFAEMLAQSRNATAAATDPLSRLRAMGVAFVQFAADNPHLVELMYESELTSPSLDPALLAYQMDGHRMLVEQIAAMRPDISEDEANLRVIAFWAAIYGYASMRRKGVIHSGSGVIGNADITPALVERVLLVASGD